MLEEQHENFVAAVRKIEICSRPPRVKMSDSEKKKKSKKVTDPAEGPGFPLNFRPN